MKRIVLIISTVITSLILSMFSGCSLFKMSEITLKPENEEILDCSISDTKVAVLTETGNVYLDGIKLYDKKDAVSVDLSSTGGCIVTEQSDIYVYADYPMKHRQLDYLCSGYSKAYLAGDDVYLLADDGKFGFVNLDQPDDFIVLGSDVVDFDIEYSEGTSPYGVYFALNAENRLYVSDLEKPLSSSKTYMDDVISVNAISFCMALSGDKNEKKYIEISFIDSDHHAYWYEGDLDESLSKITDKSNYTLAGSNIQSAVAYSRGIAMLDSKGDASIYGHDFNYFGLEGFLTGEVLFHDVKSLYSGESNLIVQYRNGDIEISDMILINKRQNILMILS